jgi:hypothetical protein
MPNGRKQSRIDRTDRDGRWQISFNRLESGRYSVEVSGIRDGKVVSRQNLSFTVQDRNSVKRGEITLDTPMNRGTYRPGNVEFSGASNGDTVRIEVYRGRDRVYTGQVSSRDGRFSSRVSLGVGSYQVTISNIRDDRVIATKKISFSVN